MKQLTDKEMETFLKDFKDINNRDIRNYVIRMSDDIHFISNICKYGLIIIIIVNIIN